MSLAYFSHPTCLLHDMGPGHPEQPARLTAIERQLRDDGVWPQLQQLVAEPAQDVHLLRAHPASYIKRLRQLVPSTGESVRLDADTMMNAHSLDAALLAAGANVQAVDQVLAGHNAAAFCAVRPPGHHAERATAMGFCLFSSVAVAALHALAAHGLERVAIVDFDVHYGNGTADIVAGDERILLCQLYQYPLYPLSSPPLERSNFSDLMLPPGGDSAAFRDGVAESWVPAIRAHRPELILFSAGFDAHRDDPLAELRLLESDFAWVTGEVMTASGAVPCVSSLEGGYDLAALGRSASAHIQALMAGQ